MLQNYLAEVEGPNQFEPLAHGYVRSLSILTNAAMHKQRRYVFNIDLENFFQSVNFGRVRGVLIKDRRFLLNNKVATVIAQIACHENTLPQGSPSSPVLSNIVGHLLDIRLVKLAKSRSCTYTRYVDDITFSTNQIEFPADLADKKPDSANEWDLGKSLMTEIERSGFTINRTKTRMQFRGSRQITTGLVVNQKVNIRAEYYRNTRAMCDRLFSTGSYYPDHGQFIRGRPIKIDLTKSIPKLEGRIEYIYRTKQISDLRESAEKKKHASAIRKLYHLLLFYKNFVALKTPLIVAEGRTDYVYLQGAIRTLTDYHPRLGRYDDAKFISALTYLRYTSTVHDILQLGGGTGDLKHFVLAYTDTLKKFEHAPLRHPVIILIDNDEGAKDLFRVAGQRDVTITHATDEKFYKLARNLYLVKTREAETESHFSCIEDFFQPELLETKLDGKAFDPKKEHGEKGKYGKVIFAERVVKTQSAKIDFSGFKFILDRIVAVLDDYPRE